MRADGDIAPQAGIEAEPDAGRIDQGRALGHRAVAQTPLQQGLGGGELRPAVDADELLGWRLDGGAEEPAPAGQRDDIGQVIFALGIVVADLGQEFPEQRAIHRHDAGIAEADPPLRGRGVAMLDDRLQPALAVGDQPAVFPGIGGPHPQHHHRGTVGGAPPGQEALEGRRRDEGGIAIEDEDVARRLVARGPRLAAPRLTERLFGREHRMAGAELLRLDGASDGAPPPC